MNWRVGWVLVVASACVAAGPKPIISEIMYDPTSGETDEQQTEWVEITNVGAAAANLQGMQLTSGTKSSPHSDKQRFVLPSVELAPGEYALIGIGSSDSYAELGLPVMAVYCGETKYAWLTNTGDSVALRDEKNNIIDEVVYGSESPWPAGGRNGSSIQFVAPAGEDPAKANDEGKNWVASVGGNSEEFKEHGRGTPGAPPAVTTVAAAPTTRPTGNEKRKAKNEK